MAKPFVSHGFRMAVKEGSPDEKALLALTDAAKRERAAARKAVARKAAAPKAAAKGTPALDKMMKRHPGVRSLRQRIVRMRLRAAEVERSKTGNKKAAATYRRVADELTKRLRALETKR